MFAAFGEILTFYNMKKYKSSFDIAMNNFTNHTKK